MITLFPDQQRSIDLLRASMRVNKAILLQGETGSGKSIMASYMIHNAGSKGNSCAFVVPRKELLFQMHKTFDKFNLRHSYVASGHKYDPFANHFLCMAGTLVNRLAHINPRVIFIDECHWGREQLHKIIMYYKLAGSWVVGLSATPEKPDGSGLDEYYDDMIIGPSIAELIALKRLSEYKLYAPSIPDLSKIKIVAGDYAKGELSNYMELDNILVGDAVKHYLSHAMGRLNITFCTSIEHSKKVAAKFNDAGVPSAHMDGNTPEDERRRIARAFARRELRNICSVDLMTFGYDLAAASGVDDVTIESMSDLRPTKSRPLQRQKNGRVLRYKDFPALIFDHSGNHKIHGLPCDPVEWSLQGRDKNKSATDEKTMPVRQCNECYFCHKPAPSCPNCGHVYPIQYRTVEEIEGELTEVKPMTEEERQKEAKKKRYQLEAVAKKRGYRNPKAWAIKHANH